MSLYNRIKTGISILIIIALLMAVISTAQAAQSSKMQPTAVASGNVTQNGKDMNGTSVTHIPPGQLKLGKINGPPMATFHNLTVTAKATTNAVVDNVRLTLAKKMASLKIDMAIRQLELYKKQITHSRISAEEKVAIIALADSNIAWYSQQESDIQAAEDLDAVNALAAGIDMQSDLLKVNIKKEAGVMACDQLDSRIATARNVLTMAAGKVADLKADGNDIADLENELADYNAHVDAAAGYADAARAAFEGISSDANADSGFDDGYRQISKADIEMNKAYADLKDFYLLYLRSSHIK
jgi:hypothetical protein